MFYRGDAAWMGLFDLQGQPYKTAFAFKAMGEMLNTPQRLRVEGTDTFGLAALAGRSADGNTVQVFISNYAIPAGYKPNYMPMPAAVLEQLPPHSGAAPEKGLARRTDIVYRDNVGYNLLIANLPWGKATFRLKRYRIDATRSLELVEEESESGGRLKISNPLPTDSVELIVLQRK
jgi:hypothetical protein